MDDYNITALNNSQHEWAIKLLNVLTPYVNEGVYSIYNEAIKICNDNKENDKYLMTFQNLLSRIPKWNNSIIETETKRIVDKSKCAYLEDLISCVHISHLKILTSVRVSKTQKKINIDVPDLKNFIHKVYTHCGRKLYTVIYLFERNLEPLIQQKNKKEIEEHINNSILNAIRESIPVEEILKEYMDESTDLIATVNKEVLVEEEKPVESVSGENLLISESKESVIASNEPIIEPKTTQAIVSVSKTPSSDDYKIPVVEKQSVIEVKEPIKSESEDNLTLKFSEIDKSITVDNIEKDIPAPKDIKTLEKISEVNNLKRKEEEEEEENDKIVISNEKINLSPLDINNVTEPLNTNDLLSDMVEVLV